MDVSYSFTPLIGYKDSLIDQHVKLPLNYPIIDNNHIKTISTTPNNEFHKKIATTGKIIKLSKQSLVSAVSISVFNDMKTIVLTPMELQSNSIGFQFQNLIIDLPHSIFSTNCITFHYSNDHILIDLVDENYLFITLKIAIDKFIFGQQLTLDNFEEWGYISVPYSFELRSSPFFVKCLDNLNLIVSLKDGGLLHFKRDEDLGEITVFNFQEQGTLIPFLGFFGGGKRKEIVLDGVSSNSIVDVLQIGDVVITLSVNKVLKLWNLGGHQNLSTLAIADDDTWLPTIPSKYLKSYKQEDGKTIVSLFINTKSGDSSKSMFVFKSFELEGSNLNDLSDLSFQPELPNSVLFSSDVFYHESNFQNTIWFIQDYEIEVQIGQSQIKYYILWKSNTSSVLVEYTINSINGAILSIHISHPNGFEIDENISAYHDTEYYMDRIFDSGNYDSLIVLTSIQILSQHWEIDSNNTDMTTQTIRQLAIDAINSKAASDNTKSYWFKLQSLCEEFKNLSQETLSLSIFDNQILTLNVNGYGIYRKSAFFESFANQKLNSPDGKLMLIFNKFETFISRKSYHKLHQELLQFQKISANDITNLFTKHIEGKISTTEIQTILTDLEQIPGIVEIVKSLIGSSGFELVDVSIPSKSLGTFYKIATVMIFRNIMETHKTLLLDLVALFFICETNDQIVEFVNQIRSNLVQYNIMEVVFDTCLTSGVVETKNMGQVQNSIFWSSIVGTHSQLKRLIGSLQLNDGYEYFYNKVLCEDYLVDVIIELINNKEYFYLREKFLTKLNQEKIVEKFLVGLIYLFNNDAKSFYEIFHNYSKFQNFSENKIKKHLNKDENLQNFTEVLFSNPSKSQYYHGLSKLVQSQIKTNTSNKSQQEEHSFIEIASDLETLAIDNESNIVTREEFYLNLFELSLRISNYDITTKCLKNLTVSTSFKNLMTKFITKIISQSKLDIIFPATNDDDDDDFYRQHFSLIDSIIDKVAKDSNLSQSLKVYQYLYSWRLFGCVVEKSHNTELGDKRGAIEALYEFITRFRIENPSVGDVGRKVKLKILEIYMIILNLLKSFENNQDQWFLKNTKEIRSIVTLNDLKLEYLEWLKNLDEDISMFT
ncbi:subunit of the nuclear pore complex (NPC), putaitve [Candida dubliniensis CD36]|uniref:Subunit of the nuclear pore complex (NPC), putaitve n=1 Tax=Candida dubliniensis (strain CD36 / ATCC MYA-646 / CBS 7987 / NCPF 3949 / NRRL Y-17841) TaxID=573826 RepID=B9WFL8_CANDC|nr:subunit of the nuclear pore complex (NPC), putaitve [Candida dubliniensis CD36]CAX42037.1 subunit of the nuclear pore complex (NPC), putaitve [Candida dubliniensis CD36]